MATTKKTLAMTAVQTTNADGSITIRPTAIVDGREIGTKEAMKMFGLSDETISNLCKIGPQNGGLSAWRTASTRQNAKWRISLQSVLDYKASRIKAARE